MAAIAACAGPCNVSPRITKSFWMVQRFWMEEQYELLYQYSRTANRTCCLCYSDRIARCSTADNRICRKDQCCAPGNCNGRCIFYRAYLKWVLYELVRQPAG